MTAKPKFASAHDLRRSFGVRWGRKFRSKILKQLMWHANIKTTLEYYAEEDQDAVAAEVWNQSGNTSGNSTPVGPDCPAKNQGEDPSKQEV